MGVAGELRTLDAKETVKIMDLNSGNNICQVAEAVTSLLPQYRYDLEVMLSNPNKREQVIACVTLDAMEKDPIVRNSEPVLQMPMLRTHHSTL